MAKRVELSGFSPGEGPGDQSGDLTGGTVVLVGAGPGDPELLTRKADAAIRAADIIFYDELVSAEIMSEIPSDITCVYVGKRQGVVGIEQADIIEGMIAAVKAGKRVVRLKAGDPMIFGRGGEEIEALHAVGISVAVVPGVTAATGAAASAGIPLTHRDHAAQLTFLTGTRRDGSLADVRGLAGKGKTLVVYMAIRRALEFTDALREDGIPGDFPIAIVENATRPKERMFTTTVDGLAGMIIDKGVRSPALLIIGDVVKAQTPVLKSLVAPLENLAAAETQFVKS